MEQTTADLFVLLEELSKKNSFQIKTTTGELVRFKGIATRHIKQLVRSIFDSDENLESFNVTASEILQECSLEPNKSINIIDRHCFLLEARCRALTAIARTSDGEEVNLEEIKSKLYENIEKEKSLFADGIYKDRDLEIAYGVPPVDVDMEISKDFQYSVKNTNNTEDIVGELFVRELTKAIKSIKIAEKEYNFRNISLTERLRLVELIPANCINDIINYIKKYKEFIDANVLDSQGRSILINASLFVVH
jgi:hypothetical protein